MNSLKATNNTVAGSGHTPFAEMRECLMHAEKISRKNVVHQTKILWVLFPKKIDYWLSLEEFPNNAISQIKFKVRR